MKDPQELDERLAEYMGKERKVGLLVSYAREWKTKGIVSPHDLAPD